MLLNIGRFFVPCKHRSLQIMRPLLCHKINITLLRLRNIFYIQKMNYIIQGASSLYTF
jgi:hypothetical protein